MLRTLLLLVLLLPGCTSIPVSTMLRMREFDQNAFVALVPADIRVRVKVPAGFAMDPAQTVLRIALSTDDGGSVMGSFPLAVIGEDLETLPGGVFSDELQLRRYELKLSPRGLELFAQAQDQLRSARAGEFKLGRLLGFRPHSRKGRIGALLDCAETGRGRGLFPVDRGCAGGLRAALKSIARKRAPTFLRGSTENL